MRCADKAASVNSLIWLDAWLTCPKFFVRGIHVVRHIVVVVEGQGSRDEGEGRESGLRDGSEDEGAGRGSKDEGERRG